MHSFRIQKSLSLIGLSLLPLLAAAQPVSFYWDIDGPTEGAGGAAPTGIWDTATANWNPNVDGLADAKTWLDGNVAMFSAGTNATGTYAVTVAGNIAADAIHFEEGNVNLSGGEIDLAGSGGVEVAAGVSATISSAVGGSAGLAKSGAGSLVLGGLNTYSGATTIGAGSLTSGGTEIIPDNSAVSVAGGATFNLNNFTETIGSLAGGGNVSLGNGNLTSGGDGTSTVFSGGISGAGGRLTKMGAGTLTLSGTNTYNGATTVVEGTLQLGGANRVAHASAVSVSSGGTFDLNNFNETVGSLAGSGLVTLGSGAMTVGGDNSSTTYSGAMSGSGRLTKAGGGTFILSGANTHTGGITVNAGVLSFPGESSATAGDANPLGAAPTSAVAGYLVVSNNATLRSTKISAGSSAFVIPNRGFTLGSGGAIFEVTDPSSVNSLVYNGILAGPGTLTKQGAGILQLQNAANTYTGNTTNLAGGLGVNAAATLGNGTGRLVLAGGEFISFSSRPAAPLANPITMTADTTIRTTSGSTTNRILPFSNNSITTSAGTLSIRNPSSASSTFYVRFYGGGFTFSRPIIIGNAADTGLSALQQYSETNTTDTTFSGVISGPGKFRRSTDGFGTGGKTIFTAANTYSGGAECNGGYIGLGINSSPAGAVGAAVTSGPVGVAAVSIGTDPTLGFFAFGGTRTLGNNIAFGAAATNLVFIGTNALNFSGAVTLNSLDISLGCSNTANTIFSGVIGGGLAGKSLVKYGAGTLVLSNANTYLNNTLVATGTLLVNNTSGNATGTGSVTVNSAATLGGIGSIGGAVTLNSGAKIAPGSVVGAGTGTLTFKNGLNLSSGGLFVWELSANATNLPGVNFDRLSVSGGNLVLGGTSTLSINISGTATAPDLTNSFWRTPHTWTVVALSGTAANPGSTRFSSITNAQYGAGSFSNYVGTAGEIVLAYQPAYLQFYALFDAGTGFFGGENLISTNAAGLTINVWSSSACGQSITNWTFVGAMSEQPLNDGTGRSRYSINLTPAASPMYYFAGKTNSGFYPPAVPVQWITTDEFGSYTVFNTNVAINAAGVLDLPSPPDIVDQPASKTVLAGKSPNFTVRANSFSPLNYQWYFNPGTPLEQGTNATLTLVGVTAVSTGAYRVVVTNTYGSITSSIATLTVMPPPKLVSQRLTNGLEIVGSAVPGDSYVALTTTNLNSPVNWVPLVTNIVGSNGLVQFTDMSIATNPQRFYLLLFP